MIDSYDALLLDLDGTVYRGNELILGAAQGIAHARNRGAQIRFVTNNASRTPGAVAEHLCALGVATTADEVRTSAQAAAQVLAQRLPHDAAVLVVGAEALFDEIRRSGLRPVADNHGTVSAVVQGLSKTLGWPELAQACIAINAGASWLACNLDSTLPTEQGFLPGNGSLVAAVEKATGCTPEVAGKPAAPLMRASAAGCTRPLMVGDRLDTDVAGAHTIGIDSLLVLSGVDTARDALALPIAERPTYLADDLTALTDGTLTSTGRWQLAVGEQRVRVTGSGTVLELARALLPQCPPHSSPIGDSAAADCLSQLGFPAAS